jgi:hypothetical protein
MEASASQGAEVTAGTVVILALFLASGALLTALIVDLSGEDK